MPLASHSEAGMGEVSRIPETGPIVNIWVSTALFHPRHAEREINVLKTGIVL